MKKYTITIALLLTIGVYPDYSRAQTPPNSSSPTLLPEVVVTGTAKPGRKQIGSNQLSVISQEEIQARQPRDMIELLRQLPGVHVDQTGTAGGREAIYIRGADSNFTVILIDGVRVNDPTNARGGSFNVATIDVRSVEKIELVRGAFSAVYGSDAMGGVINIITKRGQRETQGEAHISSGRGGFYRQHVGVSGASEHVNYALHASYHDNGEQSPDTSFLNRSVDGNVTAEVSENADISLTVRYTQGDSKSYPDDSGGSRFADIRDLEDTDNEDLLGSIRFRHAPTIDWEYALEISTFHHNENIDSPGISPGIRDPFGVPALLVDNTLERQTILARASYNGLSFGDITAGVEWIREDGRSSGTLEFFGMTIPTDFDDERDRIAPFTEIFMTPSKSSTLTAGVRLEDPENFSSKVLPRFGASHIIDQTNSKLFANWGRGYKLPSFYALSHPIVGNAGLSPETSRNLDAGIEQSFFDKTLNLRAAYFLNRFKNFVDFDEGPPPQLVNRDRVDTEGVEFSFDSPLGDNLSLQGHITFLDTDIKNTDEELRHRPDWRAGTQFHWHQSDTVSYSLNVLYVSSTIDSSIPTGERTLGGYTRFDVAAQWQVTPRLRLVGAIDNLLDKQYEEFVGFEAAGISPRLGVEVEL